MQKKQRQGIIRQLIETHALQKQSEIVSLLAQQNILATQATISRDFGELHLRKVPDATGRLIYQLPPMRHKNRRENLQFVLQKATATSQQQDYFIVLKTLPGSAAAVATTLDQSQISGLMGTIAGDDTVLIIAQSAAFAEQFQKTLTALIQSPLADFEN